MHVVMFASHLVEMALDRIMMVAEMTTQIGGIFARASISVFMNYAANIDFVVHGKPYTFSVTKWSRNGMANFMRLFFSLPRDTAVFGRLVLDEAGEAVSVPNTAQKTAAVIQACKEMLHTVGLFLENHGRAILDYAVWYRENHSEEDTYAQYITKIAAHCVVHSNFMAPSVQWPLVLFTPPPAPQAPAGYFPPLVGAAHGGGAAVAAAAATLPQSPPAGPAGAAQTAAQ
jgi:hypothetical protein